MVEIDAIISKYEEDILKLKRETTTKEHMEEELEETKKEFSQNYYAKGSYEDRVIELYLERIKEKEEEIKKCDLEVKSVRSGKNLKTITMGIVEIEKQLSKKELELKKVNLALTEYYMLDEEERKKSGKIPQDFYNQMTTIQKEIKELKEQKDKYTEFLKEIKAIELTSEEFKIIEEKSKEETEQEAPVQEETAQKAPVQEETAQKAPVQKAPAQTMTGAKKEGETTRIKLNISKEGTKIVVSRREKGKFFENSNEGKWRKLTEKIGTQDEIIRTEISKAVADELLTVDEAKKEIELYEQFVQSNDQKEKETIQDKMKLRLNYDLSGMIRAKISKENRRQLRTNAAEALELGIGDVQPAWMKTFVKLESAWKKTKPAKWIKGIGDKIAGYLPSGKGKENEPVQPDVGETVKNTEKKDRLGHRLEKTPEEIEAEETAKNIGKTVEEIQNGNDGKETR